MFQRGRTLRCAKTRLFLDRFSSVAKLPAVTAVLPDTGLPQIPTQSNKRDLLPRTPEPVKVRSTKGSDICAQC